MNCMVAMKSSRLIIHRHVPELISTIEVPHAVTPRILDSPSSVPEMYTIDFESHRYQ